MNSPRPVTADIEQIIKSAKGLERLLVAESDVIAPALHTTIKALIDLLDKVLIQYSRNMENPSPRLVLDYGVRQHDFIRAVSVGVMAVPELSNAVRRVSGDRYQRLFIDLTATMERAKAVVVWLSEQD